MQAMAAASNIDATAFSMLSYQAANGSITAKIPSDPVEAGLEVAVLACAIDTLFEGELAAWNTNKGLSIRPFTSGQESIPDKK